MVESHRGGINAIGLVARQVKSSLTEGAKQPGERDLYTHSPGCESMLVARNGCVQYPLELGVEEGLPLLGFE